MRLLFALSVWATLGCATAGDKALIDEYQRVAKTLPEQRRLARAAGFPMRAVDLKPKPIRAADNAWPEIERVYWDKAFGGIREVNRLEWTPDGRKRIEAFMVQQQARLARVERASMRGGFQVPREWNKGSGNVLFPEGVPLRSFARIFCHRAILRSERGQREAALADLKLAARMSEFARQDRFLINELIAVSIRNILARTIESCITIDPSHAQEWASMMPAPSTSRDFARIVKAELVFVNEPVDQPNLLDEMFVADFFQEEGFDSAVKIVGSKKVVLSAMAARVLQSARETVSLLSKNPPVAEAIQHFREVERKTPTAATGTWAAARNLSELLTSSVTVLVSGDQRVDLLHAMRLVREFRLEHGRNPKDLAEAGFTKLDALTGKPFRVLIRSGEICVYSVGPDLKDNGGVETGEERDVAVRYPRSHLVPAKR